MAHEGSKGVERDTEQRAGVGVDAAVETGAGEALEDATVLVVDDNEQNRELLMAYLEDLGCRVEVAADGVAAIEAIDAACPDLILLDVMMPRLSGFQVCERIKADPATKHVPVIVVTALNEVGDVERAVDAGADDFLTKPVNRLELVVRARSLLRVGRLQRRLADAEADVQRLRDGDRSG
jgi:two-component system alkaline phosphatase synthesis response regulator PhoP